MVLPKQLFFFFLLKIAAKFSIRCGAEISLETNLVPLGVGKAMTLGFKFMFLNFFFNSKYDMSILIADVESIFKVLFRN